MSTIYSVSCRLGFNDIYIDIVDDNDIDIVDDNDIDIDIIEAERRIHWRRDPEQDHEMASWS